ncbi:hypothetical protein L198_07597 [Cryptococcus wingfieldii CBS 7118]|uniref:Major facilitator superfamily (MFS) profile domain-containing protein n=1 Tax=Cryptococcus wingfieldii CBS 7118 TaxID=1295528 RepID=A0A1E3I997_9TREE|nr:hypothetical protein L198_07597 [Cryptococcus wingfieldii CBS 7118]ODN85273.1 hypothetical protein L198_07597 [Cryptococcus wingfieldii CBS 7118]
MVERLQGLPLFSRHDDSHASDSPSSIGQQGDIQSSSSAAADPIIPSTATTATCLSSSKELHESELSSKESNLDKQEGLPTPDLPPGCSWGPPITPELLDEYDLPPHPISTPSSPQRIIYVSFPQNSPKNPFFFKPWRKRAIVGVATCFTLMTAMNVGAFSIGEESMCEDLGCSQQTAAVGLGIFCFGFAVTPMILAPLSEEFGRRWTYVISVIIFLLFEIMLAAAKNTATMLVARIVQGCAGSVGATLVGGTIADIYMPADRGFPSSIFAMAGTGGSGLGPAVYAWVESNPNLRWRWIWWIQCMLIVVLIPLICLILPETRESVILRRRAHNLRKELEKSGIDVGGRFTARSEIKRVKFWKAMSVSATRPIMFLLVEPVVAFFSLWVSVAWGVLFSQVGGISYIFKTNHNLTTNEVGLVYLSIFIGAFVGFLLNFIQDAIYRRRVSKDGMEARLYGPMVAGLTFAVGCFFFAFTAVKEVHWLAPCFAIVIVIASLLTLYICCVVYLSECYGSYASSAVAAQSFLRNMFGGAFVLFIRKQYVAMTPRWTIFTWGMVGLVLSVVPFIAFWKGDVIRSHSKYSKLLMKEERERIEREKEVLDGFG